MTDLLQQGTRWLEQQREAHLSSPVIYVRGSHEAEFMATYGRTDFETDDETGLRVQGHVTDFLICAGFFTPVFGHPEPGDQIRAGSRVYEVMDISAQGCWRWSDPYRVTLRIHSRDVGAAS